mmetsp:Transcript_9622/g.18569  ORF Transcript_9622/g.18569 Transcript_9622/m.18569 type:complete len:240 (+) Transcript_9622:80-799(+)
MLIKRKETPMKPQRRFFSSPNTVSYVRIALALVGFHVSSDCPITALSLWIFAARLDGCGDDGAQKSSSSVALDIFADNLLRTVGWMAVATSHHQSQRYLVVAVTCVLLEWTTLLTSHLHATLDYNHWKQARAKDPIFVRAFFHNRFQNPLGRLGIFGLFASDLVCYAASHNISCMIPFFGIIAMTALMGRLLVACVETWLCVSFGAFLIHNLRARKDLLVQDLTDLVMKSVAWHTTKLL